MSNSIVWCKPLSSYPTRAISLVVGMYIVTIISRHIPSLIQTMNFSKPTCLSPFSIGGGATKITTTKTTHEIYELIETSAPKTFHDLSLFINQSPSTFLFSVFNWTPTFRINWSRRLIRHDFGSKKLRPSSSFPPCSWGSSPGDGISIF